MNVSISGVSDASATTDASGRYSFTGLRMGNYSVEISGFDSDAVGFSSTASSTSVGVGESKIVSFDGTYLRTAGVSGQVSVEGEGLNGVMVSLRGGPDNVDESTTTDAAGQYAFASLRAGTYTVGISGWDDTDFEFEVTSKSVTVALGETGYVEFEGELLRTSGLAGRVSAGGMGMAGVTVTLSGTADATENTDASGIYAFAGLAAGDYTVTISGYDAVEYSFDDSQDVTLEMDKTAIVNFEGMALRTASVKVMVTADGEGVAGVTATLTLVTGATSGTILSGAPTGADGSHTFGPLLAGNYRVDISGFDAEIDFADGTNWQGPVATGGMAEANFAGTINRTGSIAGMVTADGEGMGGVTVTLGGAGDASMMTADDGSYSFTGLRRGDYTVSVTNPNADMYSFPTTSRAVSVAIGQMHSDVSFAGTMIRRSSISGQVSVEGMGLEGVAVMLSGAHEATDTTDASGQYVFNGLGGGSYTVSFENPNGDAYDFDATSADVMVGNAEAATQNFSGMHTRTASVSGMLFVDEVDSNDMYDEGEEMLAAADIELALIGPTIAMRQTANTDAEGNFTFENLRMGTYQLVVGAEGVPADYGYGGPATGYEVEVTAGMGSTQNIPFDITHQTVAFSVMLKSGDMMGDALPGATVTLYADMEGKDRVASGETDEMGMTSIRFARADAAGNMAYAGVMAPDGFDVAGDMQMVSWESTDKMSEASNSQDVVNLAAEFSFAGKTITTAMGGGKELAGWAINVLMMGEDEKMEAVEDAPEMLDDMGMGSVMMTAGSAADLPMTYYVALAADQDDKMDGGESYVTTDTLMAMHNGLSVDSKMEAGTLEARYTTQTLVVAVYEERDQIEGYTATIDGGDRRSHAEVAVTVRHVAPGNRRSTFDPEVWKWDEAGADRTVWRSGGVITMRGLPADANVFVTANPASGQTVKVLYPDVLDAFENPEKNGIMGGAFGPEGGYHHTVSLCPLQSDANQDGAACGSFAFVQTYEVVGHVSKMVVERDDDVGFKDVVEDNIPGIRVGITPVPEKNIAGEATSETTPERATRTRGENLAGTSILDERYVLNFGRAAAGMYGITVPSRWHAYIGNRGQFRLPGDNLVDVDDLNSAIPAGDPKHATDSVHILVRPTTGTLYGVVHDNGDPIGDATVTVNGVSVETDIDGRYIIKDFSAIPSRASRTGAKLFISVSKDGYNTQTDNPNHLSANRRFQIKDAPDFEANEPERLDITLTESDLVATVSGTVTNSDGDPEPGVAIKVTDESEKDVLKNPVAGRDYQVTGADGSYTLQVIVTEEDEYYTVTPSAKRMYFDEPNEEVRLEAGDSDDGVDFEARAQARIRGSVKLNDVGLEGVKVTATPQNHHDDEYMPSALTSPTGRFQIWVDGDQRYDVGAAKDGYAFSAPAEDRDCRVSADGLTCEVSVDEGEGPDIGTFVAETDGMPQVELTLDPEKIAEDGGVSTVTAMLNRPHTAAVTVTISTATAGSADAFTVSDNRELTIAAGATTSAGRVTITAKADDDDIEDETITVSGSASAGVTGPDSKPLTITDDDKDGGKVTLVLTPEKISENGGKSTVMAMLATAAATEFTVTVSASAGTNASAADFEISANKALTFKVGAKKSTGTVTITAQNNNAWDADKMVTVSGSVDATEAPLIAAPEDVTLTIEEDDVPPPKVTLEFSSMTISEGAEDDANTDNVNEGVITVTAKLVGAGPVDDAAVNVTVTVATVSTDADSDAFSVSGTSLTILAGTTESDGEITITPSDDTDTDKAEVKVTAVGDNGVRNSDEYTVTITDDDAVPDAPTLTRATPGNASVELQWTLPSEEGMDDGADTPVTGYEVCYVDDCEDDADWSSISSARGTLIGSADGLTIGTEYTFHVRAVNAAGNSAKSNAMTATPTGP